jgi:molybdopterin-binding protein
LLRREAWWDCCRGSASVAVVKLSTRNQLAGTVTGVTTGEAMAVVKVQLDGGETVTSSITREAAQDLGLEVGSKVVVLIKSTEVGLGVEE